MSKVIQFRKAQRQGARLVIGISGISGSGKTRTALELAHGLAGGDASKIIFIDTENRRGSLYADCLKKPDGSVDSFLIGDLDPPFSPERYAASIIEAQAVGAEVLVIDSISHEWEGTGGYLEMREPLPGKKAKRDNFAKAEHKKMMNTLLQSPMHVIVCVRAREKVKVEVINGETKYTPLGLLPICEKNFMFEMTASLMMWSKGKEQQVMKVPDELMQILGREQGYITANDGNALRAWVDGGGQIDPEVQRHTDILRNVTEQGLKALEGAWAATPKKIKTSIGSAGLDVLKASARAYDEQRTVGAADSAELDDLNDQILGAAQAAG